MRKALIWIAGLLVVAIATGAAYAERSQREKQLEQQAMRLTGGAPKAGKSAIGRYGCGGCHQIPGVAGASGKVGPPLKGIASRVYVAGRLTNTAPNIIYWIQHPQSVEPGTGMPEMGVTATDARNIAAYLYTLK